MSAPAIIERARVIARQYRAKAEGFRKRLARRDPGVSIQDPINAEDSAERIEAVCDLAEAFTK